MNNKTVQVFGFNIYDDLLENIKLEKKIILNTISPNSYGIATKDSVFKNALIETDILVLDGVYFALASILLQGKNIKKNQGPDVFKYYMNLINQKNGKIFFLGSSEDTLSKIKLKANLEFPNIEISTFSPPFNSNFNHDENKHIIESINSFKPDILFVGMTCPKQEKWVYINKDKINVTLTCCIGAVFDWYAGNQKDIHPIWWKLRLAWLKRTIDRPEILKRYPNIGIFFKDLFLTVLKIKKIK